MKETIFHDKIGMQSSNRNTASLSTKSPLYSAIFGKKHDFRALERFREKKDALHLKIAL